MTTTEKQPTQTLLLTVGTGNLEQLRETLFTPLIKSIQAGDWAQVILLPSQFTRELASQIQQELSSVPIRLSELPQAQAENDVDACYAHFAQEIQQLMAQGHAPESICVDFTRGTKAMSAALVLAAVRFQLPRLRYIMSTQRDERGMVVPGTEQIGEFDTDDIDAGRVYEQSLMHFRSGNFAAVLDIVGTSRPGPQLSGRRQIRRLATFAAAWDRLDYESAARLDDLSLHALPPTWQAYAPTSHQIDWVKQLAAPIDNGSQVLKTERMRHLMADLLANGRRRIRLLQYEDALIRAYRILDLFAAIRLAEHGVYKSMTQYDMLKQLRELGDPFAGDLDTLAAKRKLSAQKRNRSLLIHGLTAMVGSDSQPLQHLYDALEALLIRDRPTARTDLAACTWLDFG
ncbi:MAG: hypothetical protein R3C18_04585 [Planctomycetaceae bacterium]